MSSRSFLRSLPVLIIVFISSSHWMQAQGAKQVVPQSPVSDSDADHVKERSEWFYRGRVLRGRRSAELRRRAHQARLHLRAQRAAAVAQGLSLGQAAVSSGSWIPLGPVPLASDASGNGTQDYHQVAGRATAIAIDPADQTGNTVYIGGAQGGIWKSTNATNAAANTVTWTPLTDSQPTLSIGSIAIQPGNSDVMKSVILAATGEADNSADSYFGLGILRSTDGGNTWSLIQTANGGSLSFNGLGGTRMAFSTANPNTVVSAMATTSEGIVVGAVTSGTTRGLYTSRDAGQSWTYDALIDPGGATDATSATSVVYNTGAARFFAAVRYHGFYSSSDGVTWSRLTNQPGGSVLSTAACPPQSTSNNYGCPIYRAELTAIPGRNEMYAWYVYFSPGGGAMDGGIWQSLNGGATWTSIANGGIANCGDVAGCGVEQGAYNLELLAVPNCPGGQTICTNSPTDLYAGAVNLYKCTLPSTNTTSPACSAGFLNLTHVYGCDPIAAPSHVHPDQHAVSYTIPQSGSALMYFANDGGIYRTLDGFTGLTSGSCSETNAFDDLNENLGSMAQFVSFSQHPTDQNTILGGTQDNGSPATAQATTNLSWSNVLGGDGGYNAIDPMVPSNWYASNPDIPPAGLGVQLCSSGVNCNNGGFSFVVTSASLGGDDGGFYFPYVLEPRSSTQMLVGTCRIWRGPRTGGTFTALSPNFETLGSGTCAGNEVNQVRAIAVGGPTDSGGSGVIYATTSGWGPLDGPLYTPSGGHVWVTTDASAGPAAFVDVTENGPHGNINANQFPVSDVATDSSDTSGNTAYVTIMGFTGGTGHVWKTTNAGRTWTDFTGNLPDSPVNAVVVYPPMSEVFVATDVGVFVSPISSPSWSEVGPSASPHQSGFLPNVAVTALAIFASGGQQLLRASTYGRGMWQFNLVTTPDFQLTLSNSPQTISLGQTATFNGTAIALNGYSSSVALSCTAGATSPPSTCSPNPSRLTPGTNTPFTVSASGAVGDYYFNVQGIGADSGRTTQQIGATLHVLSTIADFTLSETGSFPNVNAGSTTTNGAISIKATNGFTGAINLSCSLVSGNGSCSVNPATVTSIPATAYVTVNASHLSVGNYEFLVTGTSGATTHTLLVPFNVGDFALTGASVSIGVGAQGTAAVNVTSTYYSGNINATCDPGSLAGAICTLSPTNPVSIGTGATVPIAAAITVPKNAATSTYNINFTAQDTAGVPSHSFAIPVTVLQNFQITTSTTTQTVFPGHTSGSYNLSVQPVGTSFNSAVTLSCSAGLPAGARCLFSPSATITPGNAAQAVVMTISTAATTLGGTYPVTVMAVSSTFSYTVSLSLVVSNNFDLSISQAFTANLNVGASSTASVSVTPNYSGSITASCNLPSAMLGAACSVAPENPVIVPNLPTTLAVTLTVPQTTPPGSYTVTLIVADSVGQLNYTVHLPVTVQDFTIVSTTTNQTVMPGQTSAAYQLTISPSTAGASFSNPVTLSCSRGLPSGAQCSFNPSSPITPGGRTQTVAMTISTDRSTGTGTYPITVTGTSDLLSHSTAVSLVLQQNGGTTPDFELAVSKAIPANIDAGTAQTASLSITPNYTGSINSRCDASAMPGAQCTVTPANPVAISANVPTTLTVIVNVPNDVTPAKYSINLTVADSSGQPSHTLQLPLTVIQDFSVSSATPTQTVVAGQTSGAYQLSVAPNPPGSSFTGAVTLSCPSGLPSGAKCQFNPSSPQIPGDSATNVVLSISTAASSAALQWRTSLYAIWMIMPGVTIVSIWRKRSGARRRSWAAASVVSFSLMLFLLSCAGASSGDGGGTSSNPQTYKVTIKGSSPGTPENAAHSVVVTLVVD